MIDVDIAQTFLKVAETNSFQLAAKRLNVTQSTVSARIRTLEDRLGRRLFERGRSGARLNSRGRAFKRYAAAIVHAWDEGRRATALDGPDEERLAVGGDHNLWTRLLALLLQELRAELPGAHLSATASGKDALVDGLKQLRLDLAVMHTPPESDGLDVRKLMTDEHVLVTTDARGRFEDRYVDIEWPMSTTDRAKRDSLVTVQSRTRINLGFFSINYLIISRGAGYLPRRLVEPYLEAGYLHRARSAPTFHIPVYIVKRAGHDVPIVNKASDILRDLGSRATRNELPPPYWSGLT